MLCGVSFPVFWFVCLILVYLYIFFFFFKQKTAYEMRISDWSSDVCSSDLIDRPLDVEDRRIGFQPLHFGIAGVDGKDAPLVADLLQEAYRPAADLRRVGRRAEHGDRLRPEQPVERAEVVERRGHGEIGRAHV